MAQVANVGKLKAGTVDGYTIVLDRSNMRFEIEGANDDDGFNATTFRSYDEAVAEVQRAVKLRERRDRKKATLAVPVVTAGAHQVTVTGFHLRYGTPLFKEQTFGNPPSLYPRVAWIVAELERAKAMQEEIQAIQRRVRPFEISSRYDLRIQTGTAEQYEEGCKRFEEDVRKKADAADRQDRGAA